MPLYEYTCPRCRGTFEKLRPMSRMDEEALCPDCGVPAERRLSVFTAFSTSAEGDAAPVAGAGGCGGCGPGGCACATSLN